MDLAKVSSIALPETSGAPAIPGDAHSSESFTEQTFTQVMPDLSALDVEDKARSSAGQSHSDVVVGIDVQRWVPEPADVSPLSPLGLVGSLFEAIVNLCTAVTHNPGLTKVSRRLHDELERFFLWGEGFSALDGQLDEILTKSAELRQAVLSALYELGKIVKDDLAEHLGEVSPRLTRQEEASTELHRLLEKASTVLDSAETAVEFENVSDGESIRYDLDDVLDDMRTYIDCLMDLSPVLENPVADLEPVDQAEQPSEQFDVSSPEVLVFCRRIRDRFPKMEKYLVERLGEANAARVVNLQDLQAMYDRVLEEPQVELVPISCEPEEVRQSLYDMSEQLFSEGLPHMIAASGTYSTRRSQSVFDGVSPVVSQLPKRPPVVSHDDAQSFASYTSFSTSFSTLSKGRPRVPPLPKQVENRGMFQCLACHQTLRGISSRAEWKIHIFDDLEPYVCITRDCHTPSTRYSSSQTWAKHEASHGPARWTSRACPFCCSLEKNFTDFGKYCRHVTEHMREISLAALPRAPTEVEYDGENQSKDELENLLGDLGLETPVPSFTTANVLAKPIDIYRSYLASLLASALGIDPYTIYEAIHLPTLPSLGDLDVILPRLKLSEAELESLPLVLKNKLPPSPLFPSPFLDGIYLRLFFSPKILPRLLLSYIQSRGSSYGDEPSLGLRDPSSPELGRKRVVVEFSSPNIASEFNDRHLRSTILGAFVSNLYERMGWEVVRFNYLGDWGKQIGLLGVGWERYGSEEALKANPIGHLQNVYAKIGADFRLEIAARDKANTSGNNTTELEAQGIFAERDAFFKKMEDGDSAVLGLWKRFCDITMADLSAAYNRLGIRFDEYSGESHVKLETVAEVEEALRAKGVLEENDGAWIIDFVKHTGRKGLGTAVVRQRTGFTTYLLRDIAAALDRERTYGFDRMLYVFASKQEMHFERVFTALKLMGRGGLGRKLMHVGYGRIMTTADPLKAAHTHLLGGILNKTAEIMRDAEFTEGGVNSAASSTDDLVAVSALVAQDMSRRRGRGYVFDVKRMTSFDDSGLKLQIWHASLSAAIASLQAVEGIADAEVDYRVLEAEDTADLLRFMARYPDVTTATYRTLEPHTILIYIFRLVDAISICIAKVGVDDEEGANGESSATGATRVVDPPLGQQKARLVLYECARQVLENGMKVLGFPVVTQ